MVHLKYELMLIHFVCEVIACGNIVRTHVNSTSMVTKTLPVPKYQDSLDLADTHC